MQSVKNKLNELLKKYYNYDELKEEQFDIILFGYHRTGYKILQTLKKIKANFVVVDFNPKVILALEKEGIKGIYGDAGDKDFLNEIPIEKSKIVISTIAEEEANLTIREKLKKTNSKAVFLATADQPRSAIDLYEEGVDYVIIPHHLGGSFVSTIIQAFGTSREKYKEAGKDHYRELKKARKNSTFS